MRTLMRRLGADTDPATVLVQSASRTHVGKARPVNEDRVLDTPHRALWAVADGMGGQLRGDAAADTVIRALAELPAEFGQDALLAAVAAAHREIREAGDGQSGTTLVMLHIDGARARLWWIGDSRAYLIRDDRLQLLTRDHSLVQDLVDVGLIDQRQAAFHPQANVITRALGIGLDADLDPCGFDLEPGDRILLCSDGLSRTLDKRDLSPDLPIAGQVERLLAMALERDGSDNISLVLVEFDPLEADLSIPSETDSTRH